MTIRKRTLDLGVGYVDQHFGKRYIFPIAAGKKFPPCIKNNLEDASNDPVQLAAWEKQWPGCNWGVSHVKSGLLVADVDTNPKKGKVGQLTYDDLDLMYGWPETEMTTTPSGGFHKIYEGWADDKHPAFIMALGENGIGKDIDSPNYTLIPGCTFDDGTSYVTNGLDAVRCPEWIYDTIRTAKTKSRITNAGEVVVELDQQSNIDLAIDFLKEDAEPSIQGSGGDFNLFKAAAYLKDIGISQQLGAELLAEYFNPRCEPAWDRDDLEKKMAGAYAYTNLSKVGGKTAEADFADEPPEPPVEPMGIWDNEKKVYVKSKKKLKDQIKERKAASARDKTLASKRELPPPDPNAKTVAAICNRFVWIVGMKRFIDRVTPVGSRERDIWDTKSFDSKYNPNICPKTGSASDKLFRMKTGGPAKFPVIAFKPGEPEITNDGQAYNMYRQPTVVPEEGDIAWWNEHIEYLFPDEVYRNHLLNWMAWLVQNLAKKPKHALIIQGEVNGTGKSFIGKVLSQVLHEANVSIVPQNGLSGRFNSWAMTCKLILIEELRASDKRAVKEALHDIITEDRINIEKKGIDNFMIDSCFGVMAFTNDDAALDLDNTDRRYLVIRTDRTEAEAREKSASGYFERLFAKLEDPAAMAAVAYSLVTRDLKGYSAQQPAPQTEAKAGMKTAAMSDFEHHLFDEKTKWPLSSRVVAIEDVISSLPARIERKGFRLHHTIKKFLLTELNGVELGQCATPSGARPRLYAINGAGPILAEQPRTIAGKVYEDDKERERKKMPLDDLDANAEFVDSDDVQ
jgi:hypothetical protein